MHHASLERRTLRIVHRRHPFEIPDHLAGFDPRRIPLYRFDVIVVGGGVAGACAALAAARLGANVAVLTKSDLDHSNTQWAKGGVAAVFGSNDSWRSHFDDTLVVGCGLCEPDVVEAIVRGGPDAVRALEASGAAFDRDAGGVLALSREAGHSHARILHANGDATGSEIQRALTAALLANERIATFPDTFSIDLLRASDGAVRGVLAQTARGDRVGFTAGEVVLATGGAGQIYRETTNPVIATGDGVAMGLRAGAAARDMEFFQFHPTCLYIAGAARVLISEIVRGAGAVLRDRSGFAFMPDFHPDAELAPRDVVSRAVAQRMAETEDTNVFLDLSRVKGDVHALFPSVSRVCHFFGIDISKDPIPVRPGLHYMIGGLEVDREGRTNVPGLWAVGECASSGLHGANRMGSNSLLEGLVLGERVGANAAGASLPVRRGDLRALPEPARPSRGNIPINLPDITYSMKSLMWRQMGVIRTRDRLEASLPLLELWSRATLELGPDEPRTWELVNMLAVARLGVVAALTRTESRGVHYRSDHPDTDPKWLVHTRLVPEANGHNALTSIAVQLAPIVGARAVEAATHA
jgi:L-aspartate oxidase